MTFIAPRIGSGRFKNRYATTNELPNWYRYQKPKIKLKFKEMLTQWFLPKAEKQFERADITFIVLRENNRKIDPDAFSASAFKWAIDLLVEQGYLVDDDRVRIILEPSELNCKDITETSILMKVDFYDPVIK